MKLYRCLSTASAALLLSAATPAIADDHTGFYLGAGAGIYYVDFDDIDFDESAGNVRVFGGVRLLDFLALEVGYSQLFESSGEVLGADVDLDGDAFDVSVRPTLSLTDAVDLFGIVGWTEYDLDVTASGLGATASADASEGDLFYGLGAGLSLGDQIQVRGEWTSIDVSDADFGTLSVSATYRF